MKIMNDSLWEVQMVETQIQHHLGKKEKNSKKWKTQTRTSQVPTTSAEAKRKLPVQPVVG